MSEAESSSGTAALPPFADVRRAIPASFEPVYSASYVTDSPAFGLAGVDISDILLVHHYLYSTDSDGNAATSLSRQEADQVLVQELQARGLPRHAGRVGDVLRDLGARYFKTGRASIFRSSPMEEALTGSERTAACRLADWTAVFVLSLVPVFAAASVSH